MIRDPIRSHYPWTTMTATCLLALATTAQQVSWTRQAQGGHSFGRAVSCLASGAVAVTGRFRSDVLLGSGEASSVLLQHPALFGNSQNFVAMYEPDGQLAWAHPITTPIAGTYGDFNGFFEWNNITSVATSDDGSVVVCGWFFPQVTFGFDTASPSTLVNFPAAAGGPYPGTIINNPPTGGTFANDSRGKSMFVARYAADGTFLWARSDGGTPASDYPERVVVAADGSILLAGAVHANSWAAVPTFGLGEVNETSLADTFADMESFVARYTIDGSALWARSIRGGFSWAQDMCALSDGSALIAGWARHDPDYAIGPSLPVAGAGEPNETTLSSSPGTMCAYVCRYLSNGNLAWAIQPSQVALPGSFAQSFAKSTCGFADGSFAVAGHFRGVMTLDAGGPNATTLTSTVDQDDLFVARYAATGSLLWARRIAAGSACPSFTTGTMTSRTDGSLILSGGFQGQLIFAPGAANETTLSGTAVTFLACYDAQGGLAWARAMPGADLVEYDQMFLSEAFLGVAAFADGSFVATSTIATATGEAMLLTRFRGDVTNLSAPTPAGTNPVTVAPTNAAEAGNSDIEVTFSSVTAAGTTTATVTNGAPTPPLPANFTLAGQPKWYEISTTATYTAPIEICIDYDENGIVEESALRLLHYEGGTWVDVTTTLDTEANRICGETSSLSPFAIGLRPPVTIAAEKPVISTFGGVTTLHIETEGAYPIVTTTTGTLLGSPLDQGDGRHFTQDLQASPFAATATVTATAGGVQASVNVRFVPVDPAHSRITVSPGTTFLGGQATITVEVRDDQGQPVPGVGPVVVSTTLGTLQGTMVSSGGGVYTRGLLADAIGTAQITAKVDGLPLDEPAALTVRDPASLGAVFGIDAASNAFPYTTIQEAINHVAGDHLVHVFVAPGDHREIVKIADRHQLVIEALSGLAPVQVRGLRIDRCSQVTVRGFTIDGGGSGAAGITLAGGANGNSDLTIVDCAVTHTNRGQAGIDVGPNHGALLLLACAIVDCGGNGVQLAAGGTFTLSDCAVQGNAWNGIAVDKAATAVITQCAITGNGTLGDEKRGYGILRQRAPGTGSPTMITLIGNLLADNHGLAVPGRSDAQLGNFDQMIDGADAQAPY